MEMTGLQIVPFESRLKWLLERAAERGYLESVKYADRITFDPEQCGGRPCIRHYRLRVKDVLDMLAAGVPEAEILEDYQFLESEDIRACLEFAAEQVNHTILVTA